MKTLPITPAQGAETFSVRLVQHHYDQEFTRDGWHILLSVRTGVGFARSGRQSLAFRFRHGQAQDLLPASLQQALAGRL